MMYIVVVISHTVKAYTPCIINFPNNFHGEMLVDLPIKMYEIDIKPELRYDE